MDLRETGCEARVRFEYLALVFVMVNLLALQPES
jgi:hypothetical protein